MPELPDIELFRITAKKALHKDIRDISLRDADRLLEVSPDTLRKKLKGKQFTLTKREGKYLFIKLNTGDYLGLHFGMTGSLRYLPAKDENPDYSKLSILLDEDHTLHLISKRKLGKILIADDPDEFKKVEKIGKDAGDMERDEFIEIMNNKRGYVKSTLMNQSVISGIGNIYSDEVLFQARIDPRRRVEKLSDDERKTLYRKMKHVIKLAIEKHANPSEFPASWLLSHREEGASCPGCDGKVKKAKLSGRGYYYCPDCQQ